MDTWAFSNVTNQNVHCEKGLLWLPYKKRHSSKIETFFVCKYNYNLWSEKNSDWSYKCERHIWIRIPCDMRFVIDRVSPFRLHVCAHALTSKNLLCHFANTRSADLLIRSLLHLVNTCALLEGRMWGLSMKTTEPAVLSATAIVQIYCICLHFHSFPLETMDEGQTADIVIWFCWQFSSVSLRKWRVWCNEWDRGIYCV